MNYLFHVHRKVPTWRLVLGAGAAPPPAARMEDWALTRAREAADTNADVRRLVEEAGYCLFKVGGTFAEVDADVSADR